MKKLKQKGMGLFIGMFITGVAIIYAMVMVSLWVAVSFAELNL